jgi:hypothetical protein
MLEDMGSGDVDVSCHAQLTASKSTDVVLALRVQLKALFPLSAFP